MRGSTGPSGIFTTDTALVVRSWDPWLAEATGIPEADACGRGLEELFPELRGHGLLERLRRVVDSGMADVLAPAFHEYLLPCAPREASAHFTRMQQHVIIAPVSDGARIVGISVRIEDVTSRLDRERTLAARLREGDDAVRLEAVRSAGAEPWVMEPLLGALGDRSWRVRRAAAEGLSHVRDDAVVEALVGAVRERHRDPAVLNAAIAAITHAERDGLPRLVELLDASETGIDVRTYAALALGLLEDARAVPALVRTLDHPDANVRYHAVEALGRIGARDTAARLAELAGSRDFQLAFAALDALAAIGEPSVAPRIVPLLDDPLLHTAAAETLGRIGSEDAAGPLAALLAKPGTVVPVVAGALAMLQARVEEAYGDGELVAGLARAVITAEAAHRLTLAFGDAKGDERRGIIIVLSWLEAAGIEETLARALEHLDVRRLAAELLARRGEPAIDPLRAALSSEDDDVLTAAAAALGRLGARRAVPALLELLDGGPEVAVVAAGALARIGDARALDRLLAHLDHPNAAVRQAAVTAIDSIGHPDTLDRVRPLLGSSAPRVREGAAKVIGYFGFAECLEGLLALVDDVDDAVRRTAIEQLAHLDDPRAGAAVVRSLRAASPGERAAAARALGGIATAISLAPLREACRDADPWVRYYAARSLGLHADASAVPTLLALATSDPVPPVRIAAIEALAPTADAEIVMALRPLARDADDMIAAAALVALGAAHDRGSLDTLLEALGERADRTRAIAALTALGRRADPASVAAIAHTARSSGDHEVRALAIDVLARIGSETAISALIDMAADRRRGPLVVAALARIEEERLQVIERLFAQAPPGARCAVVEGLGRVRHRRAVPILAAVLEDPDPAVRMAAEHALRRLDLRDAESRFDVVAGAGSGDATRRVAQQSLPE